MLSNDHMHECKDENGLYKTNETTNPSSPAPTPSQPSIAVEENADLIQAIHTWLKQLTYRERRRFLEAHPELLTPRTDDVLIRRIARYAKNEEAVQDFQDHLALLCDARRRGGTVAAIREAYIDIYDGCMLDLPQWLEEIERQLIDLHKIEPSSQTVAERRDLLDKAIVYAMSDDRVAPETLAELWNMLGGTLGEFARKDPKFYEEAIRIHRQALQIYTLARYPRQYALTQRRLGNIYFERIDGERRFKLEQSITCHEAALQVYTRDTFPIERAMMQFNLGNIYRKRIEGERRSNLEQAIFYFEASIQVYTHDVFPIEWAMIQYNLGVAYSDRIDGERRSNLEQAIACYEAALQVRTLDTFPIEWAMIQNNLGNIYGKRIEGKRRANLERAIACYEAALQIRTPDSFPNERGVTQLYLGMTYYARLEGKQKDNLEQAIACYRAALQVYTRDVFPHEHRIIQLNRTNAEAKLQNWEGVHASCAEALAAEDALILLGAGAVGHDIILKEGSDAASYDGFALTRLGQVSEAAVVIEYRRAHGLAQTLTLDAGSAEEIRDMGRRTRYEDARRKFIKAQAALNDPISRDLLEDERRRIILERTDAYHRAMDVFEVVITEIRATQDPPDFLENTLSAATILRAAESGGRGHALVYLVATPWGGMAVTVLNTDPHLDASARFMVLDLPHLTDDFVRSLFETKLGYTSRIIGGYIHAQEGNGWSWLRKQWPGETFRQSAEALYAAFTAAGQVSGLAAATQKMLDASTLAHLVDQPFDHLDASALVRLRNTLGHLFLQLELQRCLEMLAEAAMQSLVAWLFERGATSLTLIPCGTLAALPLAAVKLADGRTVGEILPTSTALGARSLLHDKHEVRKRAGVYALGDPRPTRQELQWGEAEAHTLVKLAHSLGLPGEARVHNKVNDCFRQCGPRNMKWACCPRQEGCCPGDNSS